MAGGKKSSKSFIQICHFYKCLLSSTTALLRMQKLGVCRRRSAGRRCAQFEPGANAELSLRTLVGGVHSGWGPGTESPGQGSRPPHLSRRCREWGRRRSWPRSCLSAVGGGTQLPLRPVTARRRGRPRLEAGSACPAPHARARRTKTHRHRQFCTWHSWLVGGFHGPSGGAGGVAVAHARLARETPRAVSCVRGNQDGNRRSCGFLPRFQSMFHAEAREFWIFRTQRQMKL